MIDVAKLIEAKELSPPSSRPEGDNIWHKDENMKTWPIAKYEFPRLTAFEAFALLGKCLSSDVGVKADAAAGVLLSMALSCTRTRDMKGYLFEKLSSQPWDGVDNEVPSLLNFKVDATEDLPTSYRHLKLVAADIEMARTLCEGKKPEHMEAFAGAYSYWFIRLATKEPRLFEKGFEDFAGTFGKLYKKVTLSKFKPKKGIVRSVHREFETRSGLAATLVVYSTQYVMTCGTDQKKIENKHLMRGLGLLGVFQSAMPAWTFAAGAAECLNKGLVEFCSMVREAPFNKVITAIMTAVYTYQSTLTEFAEVKKVIPTLERIESLYYPISRWFVAENLKVLGRKENPDWCAFCVAIMDCKNVRKIQSSDMVGFVSDEQMKKWNTLAAKLCLALEPTETSTDSSALMQRVRADKRVIQVPTYKKTKPKKVRDDEEEEATSETESDHESDYEDAQDRRPQPGGGPTPRPQPTPGPEDHDSDQDIA